MKNIQQVLISGIKNNYVINVHINVFLGTYVIFSLIVYLEAELLEPMVTQHSVI